MNSEVRPTGAPFLRFNATIGWPLGPEASRPGVPARDGPLELSIAGHSPIPTAESFGTFGGRTLPRGLAISSEARIFLADPEGRVILTGLAGAGLGEPPEDGSPSWPFTPLWPARPLPQAAPHELAPPAHPPQDPYVLVRPTDVALSPVGDLVIVDPGAGRLLVVALPTAHLRHVIGIKGGAPTAVAFDAVGHAYVADPGLATVHRFDRNWRRDPAFPHVSAVFEAPEHVAPAWREPGSVCACGCGDERPAHAPVIYVLDKKCLVALSQAGRAETVADPRGIRLVPEPLHHVEGGLLHYRDPARPLHEPIRIEGLALTRDGRHVGSGRPLLAVPQRTTVPRSGNFTTLALDGDRPGFSWDRVTFRATIPENTRLLVQTMTSDGAIELDRIAAQPAAAWSRPLAIGAEEPPEVLVQSPPGRFLWLRVELFGDGTVTPSITEIDIYGPRRSALRYLPASFHQDPESVRFLDRFLSYFDTVFAEITDANREIAALFDPEAVPERAFLGWLGSWFDLEFLAEWDSATRREMIAEAIASFRRRGTVGGLKRILQWHTGLTDPMPQIIEHFRLPSAGEPILIGGEALKPDPPAHAATIVLPASAVPDEAARSQMLRLVAASIPAHVRVHLRLIEPGVAIGRQSTIGVDTLLGSITPQGLGTARLSQDFATRPPLAHGVVDTRPASHEGGLPC